MVEGVDKNSYPSEFVELPDQSVGPGESGESPGSLIRRRASAFLTPTDSVEVADRF